jgi:hypothetical protein
VFITLGKAYHQFEIGALYAWHNNNRNTLFERGLGYSVAVCIKLGRIEMAMGIYQQLATSNPLTDVLLMRLGGVLF